MDFKALYDRGRRSKIRHAIASGDMSALQRGKPAPEESMASEESIMVHHRQSAVMLAAVKRGDLAAAENALSNGASVEFRCTAGVTIIHEWQESEEALAREELNCRQGMTPLMIAAKNANRAMIDLLVSYGADVNARTNYGSSPYPGVLDFAANEEIRDVLMQHGARG